MKRMTVLLLILCLLLCACRKSPEATEPSTEPSVETTDGVPTEESTAEATEDPTEAPTEPDFLYQHPLTGEGLAEPWEGQVAAIVINNISDALPHHGVSQADMIFEIETEGGITRMLDIYTHFEDVGSIGPVRSARSFFNNVAVSFDAPLIHCGGSKYALNGNYDDSGNVIPNWEHVDGRFYDGSFFFRDKDRYENQGYAWEHTLFTNGANVIKMLEYTKLYKPGSQEYGLTFAEDPQVEGQKAQQVKVSFRGGKTSEFAYNEETGLYEMSQYGSRYIDAGNGQQMAFRNVIVVYSDQWFVYDGTYNRSFYDLLGSGEGLAAVDGKIQRITWHREKLEDPFTYTLEDGSALTLGVGTTYVAVTSPKSTATFQ